MATSDDADRRPGVESVLITEKLEQRPSRAPDYEAEARALSELAQELADAPQNILQRLVDLAVELCRADSAGISILEPGEGRDIFRWRAVAGAFSVNAMGTMPRENSPCGTVIDEDRILLFDRPERYYPDLAGIEPPVYENLNAPFYLHGRPIGTVWVIAHTSDRKFDTEDARVLSSIARFASAAYQVLEGLEAAHARTELEVLVAEESAALSDTSDRLHEREERYRALFNTIEQGFCVFEVLFDDTDKPYDYRWLEINPAFERHTGLKNAVGKRARELVPDLEDHWVEVYGRVALTGQPARFVQQSEALGRWFEVEAFRIGQPDERQVALLFTDITTRKQTEDALRASEERFRELVEQVKDYAIFRIDLEGQALTWNEGVQRVLGFSEDEFIGNDVTTLIFTPEAQEAGIPAKELEEATRTGTASNDRWMRRKTGEHFFALGVTTAIRNAQGQLTGFTKVMRDYTAVKHAEEAVRKSEERFRTMADTAPAILWVSGHENQTTFLSRGWHEFTGQTREEGLGFGWTECVHPDDRDEALRTFLFASEQREEFVVDYRLRCADGEYRWAIDAGRPRFDSDGQFVGYIGSIIDVHERKQAEEAVQRSNEELELRIAERTRELKNRAEQLSRLTSELSLTEQRERQRLAQVLHDHLQQLLVGANLRLNLLSRSADAAQQEGLASVRQLIDEAIGASRSLTMELAPPILHEVGLAAGLEWLARWIKDKHDLDVHLDLDERAVAEREDVRVFLFQSVRELLFNIVKHAGVSEAEVSVRVPDPEHVEIVVSDKGVGFDPDKALETDSRGDTGFGLFTIRERLSLLGGRINIASEKGQGAQFRLIAPMHANAVRRKHLAEPASTKIQGREIARVARAGEEPIRVLVVDDHKVMREGLDSLLANEPGVAVVGEAADGIEAVERATTLRPDIILMDFSLPKLDGVEATRRIKAELPQTQIIGLSMYEEPDRAAAMISAGAAAYLTKSGNSDDLLATIHAVHGSPMENAGR